jgi:hypothetical protein
MLGRKSLYRVKNKCVGGCAWQKRYNENVMVKFNYNVDKYYKFIEIHHKYILSTFKYIQIHYEYIQIHHKYIVSTFKYTMNTFKYI